MNAFLRKNSTEILVVTLIIGITLFVYYPVRFFDFVFIDDVLYICDNQHIHNGLTWDGIKWAFFTTRSGSWHPLTWISHMIDISWYHMDAGGHHWTNLQIHLLSSILLFIFLRISTQTIWISAAITSCFAFHPIHVESVAWISERKDVLSVCLAHLTLLSYLWYAQNPTNNRRTIVLLCYSMSLMSKPMMVTMPFLLFILDYWPLKRWKKSTIWALIKEKIPLVILAIVLAAFTFYSQKCEHAVNSGMAFHFRVLNAGTVYVQYLYKMLFPANLSFFYPHPRECIDIVLGISCLGFTTGMFVFAVWYRKKFPYVFTGIVWYLFTLIPVIGIVQVGTQQMADRYTYFPMTGFAIAVFLGMGDNKFKYLISTILMITFAGYSIAARHQVYAWQNSYTLSTQALENNPENNYVAHYGLADYYLKKENYSKAISHYKKTLRIAPGYYRASFQLAYSLTKNQNYEAAIKKYQQILEQDPLNANVHINMGSLYADQLNQLAQAMRHYQIALQLKPNSPLILTNYANIIMRNNPKKALEYYVQAILTDPEYLRAYVNLSNLLLTEQKKSSNLRTWCINRIKGHKNEKICLTHISQTFLARKEFQLATFFKEKANECE
jgi:tetratricopeptide (TPR) repeat protein